MINPDQAAIARGVRVKNEGDGTVWMQVTARGVPNEPQPAATQGLSVQREFLTLDGRRPTCARLRQNERLIVSISGRNLEGGYHEVALLDLLPAGFEIETVLTEEKAKPFGFLPKLSEHAHRRGPRRPLLRLVQSRPADLPLVVGFRRGAEAQHQLLSCRLLAARRRSRTAASTAATR